MADPSFVMLDFLLALKNEAVAAGVRAEGAAEKTIRVADQAELAVAVGTLIKATRLLHDRALQGEKLGHAVISLATDASVSDSNPTVQSTRQMQGCSNCRSWAAVR